ncbi:MULTISPECIES: hypothetical protein [Streptomyces]|uniref:Uncharacterized protein n=2 Tax=Streptomyces TaxID=1883 RepID=A0A2U9NZN3_STRAS|nr:hypothetical protein [Streptomyces actuosus]AWT42816.1 hypothetical protein DMT42_11105 [Streptomyces actuosus]MBM4820047.1 hypothetical protein [Streptomyces actuosus]
MSDEAQYLRTASLATAAALRGDEQSLRLLLQTLPPERVLATCEGAILAMAYLLRDFLPPDAIQHAISEAQSIAHTAATEGN